MAGVGLALGIGIGVALGVALDNVAMWLPLGVAIGLGLSVAMGSALRRAEGGGDWSGGDEPDGRGCRRRKVGLCRA